MYRYTPKKVNWLRFSFRLAVVRRILPGRAAIQSRCPQAWAPPRRRRDRSIAEGSGAGSFFGVRKIQRLTVLAAVDLGIFPELPRYFVAEEIPALQVTRAKLALFVFFITGAHTRNAPLYLGAVG